MNPAVKSIFTAALRSGYFKQDKGQLRSNKGYCCLGVLCELAEKDGIITEEMYDPADDEWQYYTKSGEYNTLMPPNAVQSWAGLTSRQVSTLGSLNDEYKKSFDEIADYIAATY